MKRLVDWVSEMVATPISWSVVEVSNVGGLIIDLIKDRPIGLMRAIQFWFSISRNTVDDRFGDRGRIIHILDLKAIKEPEDAVGGVEVVMD